MDRRANNDLSRYPFDREPPKRRLNLLRAFLIMVGAGVVAGCVLYALLSLQGAVQAKEQSQQKQTQVIEKTVYVQEERIIPYPETAEEAAEQFGGDPSDWHRMRDGGWLYQSSDESIELTVGRNVTHYTDHSLFYWE
jgi:hypothetical protein